MPAVKRTIPMRPAQIDSYLERLPTLDTTAITLAIQSLRAEQEVSGGLRLEQITALMTHYQAVLDESIVPDPIPPYHEGSPNTPGLHTAVSSRPPSYATFSQDQDLRKAALLAASRLCLPKEGGSWSGEGISYVLWLAESFVDWLEGKAPDEVSTPLQKSARQALTELESQIDIHSDIGIPPGGPGQVRVYVNGDWEWQDPPTIDLTPE